MKNKEFDWNDIRYFLAVAAEGGLTPAAQILGVTPATVSRRIDAFEHAVGSVLFLRRQTGYVLTDEGERLLESARPVEQAMLGFARQTDAGASGRWVGTVRVATSEAVAVNWLAPRLSDFVRQHPGLRVELLTGYNLANLSRRDADIGLRMTAPSREEEGDYIAHHAGAMAFAAYVAADTDIGEGGWRALPHLNWSEPLAQVPMARWTASTFAGSRAVLLTNSMNVMAMAARSGVGLAVLPVSIGDDDPRLKRVEPDQIVCARDLWVVYHRDLRDSERVVAMRDFLLAAVRRCGGDEL